MQSSAIDLAPYVAMTDAECEARIAAARRALGKRLVILAHHYQRDEVFRHADFCGDSLKLSRQASRSRADYIVFCGVHFMAEVADILSRPGQVCILPNLAAGCSLADMADLAAVQRAWQELGKVLEPEQSVTPVTYINSAAGLKAFCGAHDGIVCTSSNAPQVLEWAFKRREKILFFPDQHLGRNTGHRMGIALDDMVVWDFDLPMGGLAPAKIRAAKIILWKGLCAVHQMFQPGDIDDFKQKYPDANVICHPEASVEVCQKSDYVGSTEYIISTIHAAAAGTRWLVGTELNLVNRLREECRPAGKSVHFMSPALCMCATMFRIDPQHLLWALENLVAGRPVNQVRVPENEADRARTALARMLEVSS
jgi:quinolinate synthase